MIWFDIQSARNAIFELKKPRNVGFVGFWCIQLFNFSKENVVLVKYNDD